MTSKDLFRKNDTKRILSIIKGERVAKKTLCVDPKDPNFDKPFSALNINY